MRVGEVAAELAVHRSVAYRLLRTLEHHGLASRTEDGYVPGPALRVLLESAEQPQQRRAMPILQGVVDDLGVTAFLAVAEHDLCVTRALVEPRSDGVNLVQRSGTVHPLTLGAPGIALLVSLADTMSAARLAALAGERLAYVQEARARGWAVSHDEVIPGVRSVAVPVRGPSAGRPRSPSSTGVGPFPTRWPPSGCSTPRASSRSSRRPEERTLLPGTAGAVPGSKS